jgi:hypothetical protein
VCPKSVLNTCFLTPRRLQFLGVELIALDLMSWR